MSQIANTIRRHWMPLLGLNSVLLAATCAAISYTGMTVAPIWKANAKLSVPQTTGNLNASLGTLGNVQSGGVGFSKEVNPLQIQSSIITSNVVLERLWAADPEKSLYSLNKYKDLFVVAPQDQSTIIFLEAQGSSADIAYKRVNTLLKLYQERLNELRRNDANAREQFAQRELNNSRGNLVRAQNAMARFKQSTGLVDIGQQTTELISAINNLKTTQATVIAQIDANVTQANVAAAGLGITTTEAMNSLRLGENKEYQAIREKVGAVETALAEARGKYTNDSPQVQSLLQQYQELIRERNYRIATVIPNPTAGMDLTLGGNGSKDSRIEMIAELIRTQTTARGLQQQAAQLQNQINKLNTELSFISTNQSQFLDLQRKYEIAEGVHKSVIAQIQQVNTNPFNVYPNVQTLDQPIIDPKPLKPKRWLIALGGILAAVFGSVALTLFLESRKPLLSPKDLQQVEFPVLVRISRLKRPDLERNLEGDIEIDFQRLASTISSLKLENHRLMVTSSTFGEGKTTVTLGLALALVNFGFRVLVVDGDLQQAQMSRRLKHPHIKANANHSLVHVSPGLDFMPAPAIPKDKIAEFFARGSFERHLSIIQDSGCYDYVLVDSAPIGLTIEPTLMSAVVRNVLFVVRPGISDRDSVMDGFEQLAQHNARIVGLVINGVESQTESYRYGRQRELLEAQV